MQQVRCTNCGSTAIISDTSGSFCKCEACGSTFNVPKAAAFSKVQLDHTQDIRAWREYLAKQLKLQQDSNKARDYSGVRLFAQKILSVLPDDFCALYYVALAQRYEDNDTAFVDFLHNADLSAVTPEERREVVDSIVATVEPRYIDDVKLFIKRAYPATYLNFDVLLDRNIKLYIQKRRNAGTVERDVFICHRTAAPDQDIADAICTRLEERGLRCWIAPRNILAGSQNYDRDIIKGVENCRIFLVVSSFRSIYSEDCETELRAAVLADKALYSYRIDDTEYDGAFKKALSSVQWMDACDDPYAHLEQLVIDIKGMLAEDAREKAELEEKRLAAREKERLLAEEKRTRELERLERLEKIISGETVATAPAHNYRSRLKRAEIELGSGHYERAESIVDEVLDGDPESSLAWWILMLCDMHAKNDEELAALDRDFTVNANYKNADKFADAAMRDRIDAAIERYRTNTIKNIEATLSDAGGKFMLDDYVGLNILLDKCASAFSDENGLIYKRFPDIASKYFWLKLWAKYGQSPLVCVEDITRENEYKMAVKYASPTESAEYERTRITVSKNAQLFLRERSKSRSNDSKLIDYLVDNKNILPVETYNYYSSLMYYRKMLDQLGMTEDQLTRSTVDISTNEYFMLAQSLATESQKRQYASILRILDSNRDRKQRREREERERRTAEVRRTQTANRAGEIAEAVICMISVTVAFGLFIAGIVSTFEGEPSGMSLLIGAAVCRIIADAMVMALPGRSGYAAVSVIDLIMTLVSFLAMIYGIAGCSLIYSYSGLLEGNLGYFNVRSVFLPIFTIASFVTAVTGISNNRRKGR